MLRHFKAQRMAVALLCALLMLNLGLSSALAAPAAASGKVHISEIEKAFRNNKETIKEVEARLVKAEAYAQEVSTVIAALRTSGYDTWNLDEARADLDIHLQNLHAQLANGQALIAAHPGFDAKGKVLDRNVARKTVGDLKTTVQELRAWGGDIFYDIHREFNAFKERNPGAPFVEPARPTERSLFS